MSLKRLIPLVALAMVSVFALATSVAQASHADDTFGLADCALIPGSVAGSAALAGEDGVNSLTNDLSNTILNDTDPGHFNFAGQAICSGVDLATETGLTGAPEVIPPFIANIVASGDFDNLVCGTGTANGDAQLTDAAGIGVPPPSVEIYTEFGITFVSGAGTLELVIDADETGGAAVGGQRPTAPDGAETWPGAAITYAGPGKAGHSHVNANQVDGGNGQGVIDILPVAGQPGDPAPVVPCVNSNTTAFEVNGAFTAFLSGEGSTVSDVPGGKQDSDN